MTLEFLLINLLMVPAEIFILYHLSGHLFERRDASRSSRFLLLAAVVSDYLCVTLLHGWGPVKLLISTLSNTLWLALYYQRSLIHSFFAVILWMCYLVAGDYAGMGISVFLKGAGPALYRNGLPVFAAPIYFVALFIKVLQILGSVIGARCLGICFQNRKNSLQNWLRVLFFPAATILIGILLYSIALEMPSQMARLVPSMMILLVLDILSVYLLDLLERQDQAIQDYAILQQNLRTEESNLAAWKEAYASQRRQTHDFQNHLLVLQGLAGKDNGKLQNYLNQLLNREPALFYSFDTRRSTADILLSQKQALAARHRIALEMDLDDLSAFPLPDDALVVVLSNLLDNAIEACSQVEEPDRRRIWLRMKNGPQASYLYMENATRQPVVIRNGQVVTSKSDAQAHGFGLQNVDLMLRNNGGISAIAYNPQRRTFCFSAQVDQPAG